jgi:peptidoglycan/LPS O-acetylase OafA/YrhL
LADKRQSGADHVAALDGLRGVAAFAVMAMHFSFALGLDALPKAYLAVDFFFVLSGYVLALAYEARLKQGGYLLPFLKLRLIRLYPLIPVGMALGFAAYLARNFLSPDKHVGAAAMVTALAFALILLPFGRVPGPTETNDFPYDQTIWSLMFEVIANVAYAIAAPWLRTPVLAIILLLTGGGLVVACWDWGMLDHGAEKTYFAAGLLRVGFSFFAGVTLFRFKRPLPRVPFWLIAAVLFLTFAPGRAMVPALYDAVCVIVLFPAVVALCRQASIGPRGKAVALWSGRLSYPLYVLHPPLILVAIYLDNHFPMSAAVRWAVLAGGCAGASLFSWLVLVRYDEPVRAMLRRKADSVFRARTSRV